MAILSRKILFIFILTLSGCATTQTATRALGHYSGQTTDSFFLNYGMPIQQYELNNRDRLYRWSSGVTRYTMPSTTTYSGTAYNNGAGVTQKGTSYTTGGGIMDVECVLDILADSNNIIKQIKIIRDTWGNWELSRCYEVIVR